MLEHWAFAADLLSTIVGTECSVFFTQALTARFGGSSTLRSVEDQVLDALEIEVASAQAAPA